MYFPYFRGRQYELLALKELVQKKLISKSIIPIVEPIKLSSTFKSTMETFDNSGYSLSLVFNPSVGGYAKDNLTSILQPIRRCVMPAVLSQKNMNEVVNSLRQIGYKNEQIISILNNRDCLDEYNEIFSDSEPHYTLIYSPRFHNGNRVIFEDKFKRKEKNADYIDKDDEFFSDDHLYYKDENYVGFGDYSIIGDHFDERGFAPQAVAIHIVYIDSDKTLRIHHFVSDSNIGIEDVAGKFYEAITKLKSWYSNRNSFNLDTEALKTLLDYADRGYYPGLPTIKKLSIMHHLELVSKYIVGD